MTALDRAFLEALGSFAGACAACDHALRGLAGSDLWKGGVMVGLLWAALGSRFFREGDPELYGLRVTLGIGAALALAHGLQVLVPLRVRPFLDPEAPFTAPAGDAPSLAADFSSFPSDHAALFAALAMATAQRSLRLGGLAAAWLTLAIALPRAYLGLHYLSDLLAGALLGAGCVWLSARLPLGAAPGRRIAAWQRAHPRSFLFLAFLVSFEMATLFRSTRRLLLGIYAAVLG